jgi:hypothetical protein
MSDHKKASGPGTMTCNLVYVDSCGEPTIRALFDQYKMDLNDALDYEEGLLDFHKAFIARTKKKHGIK